MTDYDQIFFVGAPLFVIGALALVSAYRYREEKDLSPAILFFVWFAVHAMIVGFVGFAGVVIVGPAFGWIPGTASEGGFDDGRYFFNWHDDTYTEVSATTWHVAYVLEQLTSRMAGVGIVAFFASMLTLFLIVRVFGKGAATDRSPDADAKQAKI